MNTIQFERNIGQSVPAHLTIGKTKVDYLIFPMVPFETRASMIRSIIDTVVMNGQYYAHLREFAIAYYLLTTYTDMSFDAPAAQDQTSDDDEQGDESAAQETIESKSEQNVRSIAADIANTVFEMYTATEVMDDLRQTIKGYDALMREINDGIDFARDALQTSQGWNRVGAALAGLLEAVGDTLSQADLDDVLTVMQETLTSGTGGLTAT